jgi:phosphoglycolate phosphatase
MLGAPRTEARRTEMYVERGPEARHRSRQTWVHFVGRVVELVYTYALGAYAAMHESSSLSSSTKIFEMVMKKKFILFDFDGVIVDSFSVAFKVQKLICPHMTEDVYRKRFEGNINDWETPINVHSEGCRHDIDFFKEYVPLMEKDVQIFPGMSEIITELEKEYSLIVISSTITSPIQAFLERHNLAESFLQIMGNDVHKSKVEKIKMVFEKYNITSKDCVFITDTLGDMREAEKVQVKSIAVTWGFHELDTLRRGMPIAIVQSPKEIIDAVSGLFR